MNYHVLYETATELENFRRKGWAGVATTACLLTLMLLYAWYRYRRRASPATVEQRRLMRVFVAMTVMSALVCGVLLPWFASASARLTAEQCRA